MSRESRDPCADIGRRQFLQRSALAVGGAVLGAAFPHLAAPAEGAGAHFNATEIVGLGASGLKVSRLCLGTGVSGWMRESAHTRMGGQKFQQIVRGCFERGVRVFDLADLYGTHPFIIPALQGIPRDDFQIVTKIWFARGGIPDWRRPDADTVVERFLKELKTDRIDLLLLHCVTSPRWPEELADQMEIIARLKERGLVRAHGVSCHSLGALEAAVTEPWVQSVHARINPYAMSMDAPPEEVMPVLQRLHAAGKGVVGMKIVGNGRLSGDPERREASIRFALGSGCVDVLNVGCESLAQVDDIAAAIGRVRRV